MVCQPAIWFMEGVSSQKDILAAVQQIRAAGDHAFRIIASHRTDRPEILSEADYAYLEPAKSDELLAFMKRVIEKHQVKAIHAGKRGMLLEKMRAPIEALGVRLSTGANSLDTFELADNKARFSEEMAARGFASVPSVQASRPAEVSNAIVQLEAAQTAALHQAGHRHLWHGFLDPQALRQPAAGAEQSRCAHHSSGHFPHGANRC